MHPWKTAFSDSLDPRSDSLIPRSDPLLDKLLASAALVLPILTSQCERAVAGRSEIEANSGGLGVELTAKMINEIVSRNPAAVSQALRLKLSCLPSVDVVVKEEDYGIVTIRRRVSIRV
jgi:hypothetical protein